MTTGCLRTYKPAVTSTIPLPTVPVNAQEDHMRIAAAIHGGKGYYPTESTTAGEFSFTLGKSGGWHHLALKSFLYIGSYDIDETYGIGLDSIYSYYGIGAMVDAGASVPVGSFRLGIGAAGGIAAEGGDYTENPYYTDKGISPLYSLYLASSVDVTDESQLALRVGAGNPGTLFLNLSFSAHDWGVSLGAGLANDRRFSAGVSYEL